MNREYTPYEPQPGDLAMYDQVLLDRLVDGELAADERRELLAGLDHTPDGWRRCALAFLEAQSFQCEMRRVVREPMELAEQGVIASATPEHLAAGAAPRVRRSFSTHLAMAASLMLAFALGLSVRPAANGNPHDTTAIAATGDQAQAKSRQLAGSTRVDSGVPADANPPSQADAGAGRWGTVKLVVGSEPDGTPCELELPAVETDSWDDSLLNSSPAVIPPEFQQLIERLGHQVRQERELVPIRLDDGRQMVVPVDKVSFTPVAMRTYQ